MCQDCGCGLTREPQPPHGNDAVSLENATAPAVSASVSLGTPHDHGDHEHNHPHPKTAISLGRSLLEKNDRLAERNRGFFQARNLLVLNVVSSPGSGKTTFIRETAKKLSQKLRVGVIVGDLATDNDAAVLRTAGIPVVQITTGTVCHLDAEMVARAASQLDLSQLDVLFIENVGNLVCPADYDLGENLRVVLLSTTEGEDKPLKYPPLFHSAHAAIITKTDLAAAAGFDRDQALSNLKRISHHAQTFEISAKTGAGMEPWLEYLLARCVRQPH